MTTDSSSLTHQKRWKLGELAKPSVLRAVGSVRLEGDAVRLRRGLKVGDAAGFGLAEALEHVGHPKTAAFSEVKKRCNEEGRDRRG